MVAQCAEFVVDQKFTTSNVKIFIKVLSPRSVYLSGWSCCVKPSRAFLISHNVSNTSRTLKEARLETKRLWVKQHELEIQVA